jgi:D-alanyl-D-alanine carboxypeptidase/D-alanyl-D-alanine-endopeptidase (penicillin-binding protein 4)
MPKRLGPLLVLAATIGGSTWLALRWVRVHQTLPEAVSLQLDLPDAPPAMDWPPQRPDQDPTPSPGELLEQRLAGLASAYERRRIPASEVGLVEFDVEGLSTVIRDVLARVGDRAQISVHIRDLRTDHVLFDDYGDTPLNPASNQKLLTSAAALELLGPDYTFLTRVLRDDRALYIVGEGDPTLMADDLGSLAVAAAPALDFSGIERLVYDESAFSTRRLAPGYDPGGPGVAWAPESCALAVGYNFVEITAVADAKAKRVVVTTEPRSSAITIDNRAKLGSKRALDIRTTERDGRTVVAVRGTMTKRSPPVSARRRLHDPAHVAATIFAEVLAELTASQPLPVERGVTPETAEELVSHESAPLAEILDLGLAYSNNFIAEQVLRTLAWRMTGEPGGWAAGEDILRGYWSALGHDPDEIVIANGSGLTHEGRLTTTGLVDLLAMAARGSAAGASLLDALPVAGEPGTLRSRLRLSGKRVRAKTGTLDDVSGLTGVITSEDGTPQIAFSILINAYDVARLDAPVRRSIEDRIVTATLYALDHYEAKMAGLVDPQTDSPLAGTRALAPWRGSQPAKR